MTTGLLTTTLGQAAIAADLAGGADLALTHVAFGDSSGTPYTPNPAQVALVNERYRATISSVSVIDGAIVIDAIIPADTPDGSSRPSHGFSVAEAGIFSSAGALIAVARMSNGYKPSPGSGQASIATFRFKLAVSNPSAITVVIDPQAQVNVGRHVRPFWQTVDGVLNTPPSSPSLGATYVIGAAPTGAWAGFEHRLAQWVGVWALASVPVGHQVVDSSKNRYAADRWLERTASGWDNGLGRYIQFGGLNYGTASASGNAWTVTLPLTPAIFLDGFRCWFHAPAVPTGNVTLAVNGGSGNLVGPDGIVVGEGDTLSAQAIEVIYRNGVGWQMTTSRLRQFQRTGRRQVFTSSGSFVVPAPNVLVTVIGGGAGGSASGDGSGGGVAGNCGAGGGAGGYAQKTITGLTVGSTITVTVGGGGAGGVKPGTGQGQVGGSSSFGAHCSASGGGIAPWGENTLSNGGAGGTGTGGDINIQGTDGGCTGPNVALGSPATMSDTHRIYNRGGIAAGGLSTMALGLSTGASGRGFGTGGGGATGGSGLGGGAGAPGVVIVEW